MTSYPLRTFYIFLLYYVANPSPKFLKIEIMEKKTEKKIKMKKKIKKVKFISFSSYTNRRSGKKKYSYYKPKSMDRVYAKA